MGVFLIVLILISGYRRASKAFQRDPELGSLMLAYVATGTFYSITEAGFRMLTPSWIFLLLAVVGASGVVAGLLGGEAPKIIAPGGGTASRTPASDKLIPEREPFTPPGAGGLNLRSPAQLSPLVIQFGFSMQ